MRVRIAAFTTGAGLLPMGPCPEHDLDIEGTGSAVERVLEELLKQGKINGAAGVVLRVDDLRLLLSAVDLCGTLHRKRSIRVPKPARPPPEPPAEPKEHRGYAEGRSWRCGCSKSLIFTTEEDLKDHLGGGP